MIIRPVLHTCDQALVAKYNDIWHEAKVIAGEKVLLLLRSYCDINFFQSWLGSHSHIDKLQQIINIYDTNNKLPIFFRHPSFIIFLINEYLDIKTINPEGDLAALLEVIKQNTDIDPFLLHKTSVLNHLFKKNKIILQNIDFNEMKSINVSTLANKALNIINLFDKKDLNLLVENKIISIVEVLYFDYDELLKANKNTDLAALLLSYKFELNPFLEMLKLKAQEGDAQALGLLGHYYTNELGTQAIQAGFKCYLASATQGDAVAQCQSGICYQQGVGVSQDSKKAFILFLKAAVQGNVQAKYELGECYLNGKGVAENQQKGFLMHLEAAAQGYARSQYKVGLCYKLAKGTVKDLLKAFQWLLAAAEQDHIAAQAQVGHAFFYGIGIDKDIKQAQIWTQKAAVKGEPWAQYYLGCYEIADDNAKKDEKAAFEWFRKAAVQGHALSQYQLGKFCRWGRGTFVDPRAAFAWYQKAADSNLELAQYELGYAYLNGIGVSKMPDIGMNWMRKAAANHNVRAKFFVDGILSTDPNTILKNCVNSKDCFMPEVFPELADQVTFYCGSSAFAALVNYCGWLDILLFASLYEKRQARVRDDNHKNVVLETLKLTPFASEGPQFDVNSFQALANAYQIKNCRVIILPKDISLEEYRKTICESFTKGNALIIPFDQENSLPAARAGLGAHWALFFGYREGMVAATQHGIRCEMSVAEVHASNQQMPDKNPYAQSNDKDFNFTMFEMALNNFKERKFIQHTPSA